MFTLLYTYCIYRDRYISNSVLKEQTILLIFDKFINVSDFSHMRIERNIMYEGTHAQRNGLV